MQAAKWVVAKLQGGKIASFCRNMSGREKFLYRYEKRFEKREKESEKRSETRLKNV